MKVYVDADACPNVREIVETVKKFGGETILVKNHHHRIVSDEATVLTVDDQSNAADFVIANAVGCGDLVITNDLGLSAMILAKKGRVINSNGERLSEHMIAQKLEFRHLAMQARKRGIRLSSTKKRTDKDRDHLIHSLMEHLQKEDCHE